MQALEHSGIISGFRAVPFLPALSGGMWGRYAVRLHEQNPDLERRLMEGLDALEESIHNAVFSTRRFPRTSFFFFSRTEEEINLVLRELGISEKPFFLKAYNFPFKAELSDEERMLLRTVSRTGKVLPQLLARELVSEPLRIASKLRRLVLHSDNPQGVVVLRPTIHWYRITNFMHVHVLLPLDAKERLSELCSGLDWQVLKWPGESKDMVAVEIDFSGWGDFAEWKELCALKGFELSGFAFFAEERVYGRGFEF